MKLTDIPLDVLLDLFPINIYVFDRENRLVWLNKQMMEAASIRSREHVCGRPMRDILTELDWKPDIMEPVIANNQQVIDSGESYNFEEEGYFRGQMRYYLSQKIPFHDTNGELSGVIGMSFDITQRKENERLRLEKQQMEGAMQSLKMLAASMAHELRTPLVGTKAGVLGLEKLCKKFQEPDNTKNLQETVTPVLENMKIQLQQALLFIDLSLANFKVSKIDRTAFTYLNMKQVVEQTLQDYPFQAAEREIVHWESENAENFIFYGSLTLTKHVLFNLIKNATYYARCVRSGTVSLKIHNDSHGHRFVIRDTGQGIPPDILPKIFDVFFTNKELGTGVGLSFCKMVMDEYGGSIHCNSKVGEFTEFTLLFPPISPDTILTI